MTSAWRLSRLLVPGAVLALVACSDDEPCAGVVEGATYQVDIVGQDPAETSSSCAGDWGFNAGDTFDLQVDKLLDAGGCQVGIPQIKGLSGWAFTEQTTGTPNGGYLQGGYLGTIGACSTLVTLEVDSGGPDQPCFSDGSASAKCRLTLHFEPKSAGCPGSSCAAFLSTIVTQR